MTNIVCLAVHWYLVPVKHDYALWGLRILIYTYTLSEHQLVTLHYLFVLRPGRAVPCFEVLGFWADPTFYTLTLFQSNHNIKTACSSMRTRCMTSVFDATVDDMSGLLQLDVQHSDSKPAVCRKSYRNRFFERVKSVGQLCFEQLVQVNIDWNEGCHLRSRIKFK